MATPKPELEEDPRLDEHGEDSQAYRYQPIDHGKQEIRIVTLHPGSFDDPITISINVTALVPVSQPPSDRLSLDKLRETLPEDTYAYQSLDGRYFFDHSGGYSKMLWEHPDPSISPSKYAPLDLDTSLATVRYEALSYAWGPEGIEHTITVIATDCESEEPSTARNVTQTIRVRNNLYLALKYLRLENKSRNLWIDAICIDQSNISERNRHVPRMREVYRLAHRVVVWLGDHSGETQLAFDTLKQLARQVIAEDSGLICLAPESDYDAIANVNPAVKEIEKLGNGALLAIKSLFSNPYFDRLWIWQEIRASFTRAIVLCGRQQVPWSIFASSASGLTVQSHDFYLQKVARRVAQLCDASLTDSEVIMASWTKLCLEPRDRIYGVLGIISPLLADKTIVQYSSPLREVFRQFFILHVEVTQRLELLTFCFPDHHKMDPSWKPDLTMKHGTSSHPAVLPYTSGHSAASANFQRLETLKVEGIQCSTIEEMNAFRPQSELSNAKEVIENWYPGDPQLLEEATYIDGESLLDAFCGVISYNQTWEKLHYSHWPTHAEWKHLVRQCLSKNRPSPKWNVLETAAARMMMDNVVGHTFIKLHDGHIGIGSTSFRPGDVVCVLLGADYPVVFRSASDGRYSVIGECYIHGLGEGQALLGTISDPWRVLYTRDEDGDHRRVRFFNTDTNQETFEDPRLPPIPEPWVRIPYFREPHDPIRIDKFRNTLTGEVMNSDPRLLPDALKARGVKLKTFEVV